MAKLILTSVDVGFQAKFYTYTLTYNAIEPCNSGDFPHEIEVNLNESPEKYFKMPTSVPPTPKEEKKVVVNNAISQLEISD